MQHVLAITHTLTMYYIFSGLAVKGLTTVLWTVSVKGWLGSEQWL